MSATLTRIKTLAAAANTWLVAGGIVVGIIAEEIADELSGDTAADVVRIGGKIVGWLGAAAAIVRRSTTVIESQRGLLPVAGPVVPEANVE